MVEESFAFLEDNRVAVRPEHDEFSESVAEFMQRNKMKVRVTVQDIWISNRIQLSQLTKTEAKFDIL